MTRVLTSANANIRAGTELALASGQVIATRLAPGADPAELARMVPEKIAAFSAAGAELAEQSGRMLRQMARFAQTEASATTSAAFAIAACRTPASLAAAQASFVTGWFARAMSQSLALGALALRAQGKAMAPVHRAATGNARRLGR